MLVGVANGVAGSDSAAEGSAGPDYASSKISSLVNFISL